VVQLLAPLGLFTPALQKTQEAAPAEPEYFPEGHNSQKAVPAVALKYPAGHIAQVPEATASSYPASQLMAAATLAYDSQKAKKCSMGQAFPCPCITPTTWMGSQ
jgi:hypothetical protein